MRPTLSKALPYVLERRRRIWLAAILTAALFGTFSFFVSSWLLSVKIAPNLHAAVQASIVGLGAGAAILYLLLGINERKKIVADELRRVAELNHALRNSLEVIVMAHHGETDCEHREMVLECTTRIDQTLKRLFPGLATGTENRTSIQ